MVGNVRIPPTIGAGASRNPRFEPQRGRIEVITGELARVIAIQYVYSAHTELASRADP